MKIDYTVSAELIAEIREQLAAGVKVKELLTAVQGATGWGKTKAREVINGVIDADNPANKEGQKAVDQACKNSDATPNIKHVTELEWNTVDSIPIADFKGLSIEDKHGSSITMTGGNVYVTSAKDELAATVEKIEDCGTHIFNHDTNQFVWQLKKGEPVVISAGTWKAVLREYKGNATIQQIAAKYSILPTVLKEIFAKEGITHDSHPFTSQEVKNKPIEVLSEEERKFKFSQDLEKEAWKATQKDADAWRAFEYGTLNPFEQFLKSWKPPVYKSLAWKSTGIDSRNINAKKAKTLVVGAFDWHFGAREEERYMFKGKEWNIEQAHKAVERYTEGINAKVLDSASGFNKCVFLLGGDLFNSLTGFTENGTKLNNEYGRDTQFEAVMNAILFFVKRLLEIFPEVECHFVRGNHGGTTDIPLAWTVKNYFHAEPRLKFNITSKRIATIRVKDVLILMEHGASDQAKHLVPGPGKAREAYIQNLFLAHPEELIGVKQKLFIQGDLHHYEQTEYSNFEYFMFGALPCGSQYADAKGLNNRPRQNCLVIDETGVADVMHVYLD